MVESALQHNWQWLGNVAIACQQCTFCKIFRPYDKKLEESLGPCYKRLYAETQLCGCGGFKYKCALYGHIKVGKWKEET